MKSPDNSDFLVTGVGGAGSAGDRKHIFFELNFLSGHRDRFHISFSDMDTVVLTLQAAVTKEFAGQPGPWLFAARGPSCRQILPLELRLAQERRRWSRSR